MNSAEKIDVETNSLRSEPFAERCGRLTRDALAVGGLGMIALATEANGDMLKLNLTRAGIVTMVAALVAETAAIVYEEVRGMFRTSESPRGG